LGFGGQRIVHLHPCFSSSFILSFGISFFIKSVRWLLTYKMLTWLVLDRDFESKNVNYSNIMLTIQMIRRKFMMLMETRSRTLKIIFVKRCCQAEIKVIDKSHFVVSKKNILKLTRGRPLPIVSYTIVAI